MVLFLSSVVDACVIVVGYKCCACGCVGTVIVVVGVVAVVAGFVIVCCVGVAWFLNCCLSYLCCR